MSRSGAAGICNNSVRTQNFSFFFSSVAVHRVQEHHFVRKMLVYELNFHDIRGYGNIARMLGLSYFRYDAVNENDRLVDGKLGGMRLDIKKVAQAVEVAVTHVLTNFSCIV